MSLQNSPLSQVLLSDSNMSPFVYSVYSSLPPTSRQKVFQKGSIGFGKTTSFNVPRYGVLAGCVLRVNITGTGLDPGVNFGNALLKNAVLSSHSREIIRLETMGNYNKLIDKTDNTQAALMVVAGNVEGNDLTSGGDYYIPLNFSLFDNMASYLDTSFIEQLEVSVSLNSADDVLQAGSSAAFDTEKSGIIFYYLNMSESDLRSLQNSNFSLDRPLSILTKSYYKETDVKYTASATGTYDFTIQLNCPNLISRTIIGLISTSGSGTASKGQMGNYIPISSVEISSSGRVIYEYSSRLEVILENALFFDKAVAIVNAEAYTTSSLSYSSNLFIHNWGLGGDPARFSGGVSGKGSSNLTIKVTASVVSGTVYTLMCENEYFSIVSISGGSGKISNSISL